MRIFGFTPHPEVIHNAAPVAPTQPLAPLHAIPRLSELKQDTFVRAQPVPVGQLMTHEHALRQVTAMTPPGLRAQIAQKMATASDTDLSQVTSWLSAAYKEGKIQFSKRDNAEVNFGKHLRESTDALAVQDLPVAKISLQRARRQIFDFQHLRPEQTVDPTFPPPNNPFILHY